MVTSNNKRNAGAEQAQLPSRSTRTRVSGTQCETHDEHGDVRICLMFITI